MSKPNKEEAQRRMARRIGVSERTPSLQSVVNHALDYGWVDCCSDANNWAELERRVDRAAMGGLISGARLLRTQDLTRSKKAYVGGLGPYLTAHNSAATRLGYEHLLDVAALGFVYQEDPETEELRLVEHEQFAASLRGLTWGHYKKLRSENGLLQD